jgi:hypothetical protein
MYFEWPNERSLMHSETCTNHHSEEREEGAHHGKVALSLI